MAVLNKYLEIEGIAELRQWFVDKGSPRKYDKGDYFIMQEQQSLSLGYVQKGAFHYTHCNPIGVERTVGFSFENDFVMAYTSTSIQNKTSSVVNIQAIKESLVLELSFKSFNEFFDCCHIVGLKQMVDESIIMDTYNRLLSLYCDSPEERYTKLLKRYPEILNLVSLKEIASFLNIAPETLSRVRKRISSK